MSTAPPAEASDGLIGPASARRWLRLAVYAALVAMAAGGLVFLLTFDASALGELRHLGPWKVSLLVLLMLGTWGAGAARLVLLTRSLGHSLSGRGGMAVSMAGEFGVTASPTGVGGTVLRLGLLRLYGVPMTDATAVAGADLVIDAAVAVVFTLVAVPLAFLLPGPRVLMEALAAQLAGHLTKVLLVALLLVVVAAVTWRVVRARRARRALAMGGVAAGRSAADAMMSPGGSAAGGRIAESADAPPGWRQRAAVALARVREGLRALLRHNPRVLASCLALGIVQVACRYSVLPVLVQVLHGGAPFFALFLLQAVLLTISHALVVPGGGGGVELGAGVLLPAFLPAGLAGIVVLLWRFFTYHLVLLAGGTVFFVTLLRRRRKV